MSPAEWTNPYAILCAVSVGLFGFFGTYWYRQMRRMFLNGEPQELTLVDRKRLSHDTQRLRFCLDRPEQLLGLPVGQHIRFFVPNREGKVVGEWNQKPDTVLGQSEIQRAYTPVTGDESKGSVELVIKVYQAGLKPEFPDGGRCSQYLGSLAIGSKVKILGPVGRLRYNGGGMFESSKKVLPGPPKTKIAMIAGGTGITPMLQILQAVLRSGDPADAEIEIRMIFANQTEEDIICRDYLEQYRSEFPDRFKLWYTIDNADASPGWSYSVGYVTEQMIQDHLFLPSNDTLCLLCGPSAMSKVCSDMLQNALGFDKNSIAFF